MRVLVISNIYPPHVIGGYEIGCHDVVTGLRRRGHEVSVLTTGDRADDVAGDGTLRGLRLVSPLSDEPPATSAIRRQVHAASNAATLARQVRRWEPDLIYVWNARGLGRPLLRTLGLLQVPVVLFVFDHWYAAMLARGWRTALTFGSGSNLHAQFGSKFLASRFPTDRVGSSTVVAWGVEPATTPDATVGRAGRSGLLFIGQVEPHKGVHTAVAALADLRGRGHDVDLDIVGPARNPTYAADLERLASSLSVQPHVHLRGPVPRADVMRRLHTAAVMVFPSEWEEPLGITILEAMSAGLPVVATGTGGSAELVADGRGRTFAPGDAAACADQVAAVLVDQSLWTQLSDAGRSFAHDHRSFTHTIDVVEADLLEVLGRSRRGQTPARVLGGRGGRGARRAARARRAGS